VKDWLGLHLRTYSAHSEDSCYILF
jgi:hypothetical protein